jgi:hypothetical protein
MKKTFEEARIDLKSLCPYCDGSGTIANGHTVMKYGQDDNGNAFELGTTIEYEPVQCQWCYEFDLRLTSLLEAWDESKWKPYPENKPESDGQYLVTMNYNDKIRIHNADYIHVTGRWIRFYDMTKIVTAFRELPAPYTGKEE